MANIFTNLEQDALISLDTVSKERVGFINAVRTDFSTEMLAKDRVVRSFVAPQNSMADTTASQLPPDTGDHTFTNKTLTIDKDRHYAIRWTAEDLMQMNGGGPGASMMMQDQLAQAYRSIRNEVEVDIAALYYKASRAHSPLGTNLFDSTGGIKDVAAAKQILIDNGAPEGDISLVVGSASNVNLLGVPNLYKANEAADVNFLRRGILGSVFGVDLRHSAQVSAHTNGTAANTPDTDATGYAIGSTVITLDASAPSGTGSFVAGDVVTFGTDTNEYVILSGDADITDGGTITIGAPGLRVAIPAAETVIALIDQANERNMIFSRNAIALATRLPAYIPGEEDQRVVVQDPDSGLAFQILTYFEHKRMHMQVGLAWGVEVMKPEHLALVID